MNSDEHQHKHKQPLMLMVVVGVLLITVVVGISIFLNNLRNIGEHLDPSISGIFDATQLVIDANGTRHFVKYELALSNNKYNMVITSDEIALLSRGNIRVDSEGLWLDVIAGELTADLNRLDQDLAYRLLRVRTPHIALRLTQQQNCWDFEDVFVILCKKSADQL